ERRERRVHAGWRLRLRRNRRRHAREEPDDGQLAARVHGLRPSRRGGRRREGARMSLVATDLQHAVEEAAAHLYVWALKDIPQDLRDALVEAQDREASVPGQLVLNTIVKNVAVAAGQNTLVCHDSGIAVYKCRIRE